MATLADIRRAAECDVRTGTDDTTPAGTFYATTKMLGIVTTYLLAGTDGDDAAPIIGRLESHAGVTIAARGTGLKGGSPIPRADRVSSAAAFRAMYDAIDGRIIVHADTTALNSRDRVVQVPAGTYQTFPVDDVYRPIAGMTYFVGPRGYVWHIDAASDPRVSVI